MDIMLERILSLVPRKADGDFVHGSLKDFAESIGLKSGNVIADWVSGRSKSYKKKLHEISDKYNVSVEWLEGKTDQKEKAAAVSSDGLTDEETTFLNEFRLMSEAERKFLLAQMRGVTSARD